MITPRAMSEGLGEGESVLKNWLQLTDLRETNAHFLGILSVPLKRVTLCS